MIDRLVWNLMFLVLIFWPRGDLTRLGDGVRRGTEWVRAGYYYLNDNVFGFGDGLHSCYWVCMYQVRLDGFLVYSTILL